MPRFLNETERLRNALERKVKFIKSLPDPEFFAELLNYLEFIVTEPGFRQIFFKLNRIKEQDFKEVRKYRSKLLRGCLKKKKKIERVLRSKGLIDTTVQSSLEEFEQYRSGKLKSSTPLENSLRLFLERIVSHIGKSRNDIEEIEKLLIRDRNGRILKTKLFDFEDKLQEIEDELALKEKHSVWMSWDRLLTISYSAYGYRKDWDRLTKRKHFLDLITASLLVTEFQKAIASSGSASISRSSYFKRNEYQIDILRVHNFILDELDKEIVGLSIMEKYKKLVEWYLYDEYKKFCEEKDEKYLSRRLGEFLFQHNVFPVMKPLFGIKEPDILAEMPGERLPIEVKKFGRKDTVAKLHEGIKQAYEYVRTLEQDYGHFVIFNYSNRIILHPPQIDYENIIIHIHVVDVSQISPSKRKKSPVKIERSYLKKLLK